MGDFFPHEQQGFFAHQLGHQLFFRHIGKSIVVKVMRAGVGVLLQQREQFFTAGAILGGNGDDRIKNTELFHLLFAGFQRGKIIQQVHLVDDRDRRTCFAQCFHHAKLGFGKFPGRLK